MYKVIEWLEECFGDIFTWFGNNRMKANPERCNLLVSKEKTSTTVIFDNIKIDLNGVKI